METNGERVKMIDVSGYQIIKQLYESANSLVYRGLRQVDKQPVILKMLKIAYPPPEKIAWFKREYETTQNLKLAGVVSAYSLENDHNRWVMVLEDFGGQSLEQLQLTGKLALRDFLTLAIEITQVLGQIHQKYIIHKDINPSNIIFNPTTKQVKLIDFGISTVLSRENSTFRNPNLLEGTLAYISPEQTGRMNRAIDYRTDFYSLGVTFYELLTGQLPFPTQSALELVHCHIARTPVPPHEHQPKIPLAISHIVLKLMAKNAEDRYQSAHGLKTDLEICLIQWQAKGQIDFFPLGQQDVSDRFQIPQKLYGREQEIASLMAAIERVSFGASEIMLVCGYSGIGKSALVQEVYKPITRQRGYFISGKFDQLQRNIPYASLIQAFRSLVLQLLTESDEAIATWRLKLLAALGANGQVMIEVIPEVELIIGPQPELPVLGAAESQNRFNLVFQNFIKVFTLPEHPLVIFLDDLQWADGASLKLIELLMTAASEYLLLIGAYRDNEVSAVHPLMLTLSEIKKAKATVNQISLSPLALPHITELITDILHCEPATALGLAELVHTKTAGNPFFVTEFLKSLYAETLLKFNYERGAWQWELGQIQSRQITANVVELMANKVQKLPPKTQAVLKLAACVGNQFDLEKLAKVYEKSPQLTAAALWAALAEGLILPLNDAYKLMELDVAGISEQLAAEYKFAHDRIQQAVYSLIPEADKQAVHLRVGQLLLQNTPSQELELQLFDIVSQLNLGRTLIDEQKEREQLVQLNLQAGQKAKASAAYQSAFNYLKIGREMLALDSWQTQYDLTLELYEEAAEAAYLSSDFEEMERLIEIVLQQAKTLLNKAKVYEVKILAYTSQNKPIEAINIALQVLKLLGVGFPKQPSQSDVMLALQEINSALANRQPEELIDLPTMTEPVILIAMRLLMLTTLTSFLANPALSPLIVLKQVNLSLKHGNAAESAYGYANYGLLLCNFLGDIEQGYQFGQLALQLVSKLNAKQFLAKIFHIVYFGIIVFKEHIKEKLSPLLSAYQNAIETGDFIYANMMLHSYYFHKYLIGRELEKMAQEMSKFTNIIYETKQKALLHLHLIFCQLFLNLIGRAQATSRLSGEVYDADKMLPIYLEANYIQGIFVTYYCQLILDYFFDNTHSALATAVKLEEYLFIGSGFIRVSSRFYGSLVRLAVFPDAPKSEQERLLEKVAANQEEMATWAQHAPMNCLHKFYLVEAERARVLGKYGDAREYYDQAIALAQSNEYVNEEALAYELAGRFYLARNQNHFAGHYLHAAHYAYQRWGATAKVKDLEARYPQFLATTSSGIKDNKTTIKTTDSESVEKLDLATVMKASQVISGEIVLTKLLEKLMTTVIENAGAQKGFLILDKVGNWVIEAEGAVDSDTVTTLQSIPLDSLDSSSQHPLLSVAIINYVARTQKNVVLYDASQEGQFTRDAYILSTQPKSILCTPLLNQGKLSGIVYLENNLTTGAFTRDRVEVLRLLCSQAAISIENSRLYQQLEHYNRNLEIKVEERTQELHQKNQELATTLQQLKATQEQIIVQEKLASLGALTAGIAHEIRNPLNFINNFAELSADLTQELVEEIENQKDRLDSETVEYIEEILTDIEQNVKKIKEHGKRADNIVRGMLMHSRGKTGERELTDINALLAEYVNLAYHGMRAKDSSFNISIETNYDDSVGQVNVVPQNISRVFLNIINNACYAAHEKKKEVGEAFSPMLSVSTKNLGEQVEIRIRDNGKGIPQDVLNKIFNPFFTTKPTGEGTGLGLSISHDIVVQEHKGSIKVETEVGSYAEFIIILPNVANDTE